MEVHHTVSDVNYSARDWQLYSDKEGVEQVAERLNQAFVTAVRMYASPARVYAAMSAELAKYAQFGAFDTEPRVHLERMMRKVYGEDWGR